MINLNNSCTITLNEALTEKGRSEINLNNSCTITDIVCAAVSSTC